MLYSWGGTEAHARGAWQRPFRPMTAKTEEGTRVRVPVTGLSRMTQHPTTRIHISERSVASPGTTDWWANHQHISLGRTPQVQITASFSSSSIIYLDFLRSLFIIDSCGHLWFSWRPFCPGLTRELWQEGWLKGNGMISYDNPCIIIVNAFIYQISIWLAAPEDLRCRTFLLWCVCMKWRPL